MSSLHEVKNTTSLRRPKTATSKTLQHNGHAKKRFSSIRQNEILMFTASVNQNSTLEAYISSPTGAPVPQRCNWEDAAERQDREKIIVSIFQSNNLKTRLENAERLTFF